MPTQEFVMQGQTASGTTEVLNFGSKHGYAFRLIGFHLWGSTALGTGKFEGYGTITAGKTAVTPTDPDFSNQGLIGVSSLQDHQDDAYGPTEGFVINDTYLITQNIILMVQDTGGSDYPVNWQCRFKPVKMSETEMANANLRQFHVFDE